MSKFFALYLPQFHPIPENDEWWGKGFTEWTNVAKAKPLFKGHLQPRIPADLGFYDLRLPEVREQQAELARMAGIEAFCYYEYWFGNGRQLMERPFEEVVSTGKPDFPFCLCWANHSWYKKLWDPQKKGKDKLLIEQKYPGKDDYINHFNHLLPAFRDKRYVRVNGKLVYVIYDVKGFKEVSSFIALWRKLANDNGLNDFYFIATDFNSENRREYIAMGFDAIHNIDYINIYHTAIKYMIHPTCSERDVIPVIVPNWDHTPRSSFKGTVLTNSKPIFFKQHAKEALTMVKDKPEEERIVFLKSWNEWGEGNYMEPDYKFGDGYIKALSEAINEID